jgi:hypothetical protein
MEPPASEAPKAAANAKCKKPSRPKRPLSAYNLFYRFKRQKMIDGIAMGKTDRTSITLLIEAAPGLEFYPPGATEGAPPDLVWDLRRRNIRHVMNHNLLPRDTRDRSHRKNRDAMNGAVGFLELGRMMNASWLSCDDFAKGVFRELAEEGREHYRMNLKKFKQVENGAESPAAEVDPSTTQPSVKETAAVEAFKNVPQVARSGVQSQLPVESRLVSADNSPRGSFQALKNQVMGAKQMSRAAACAAPPVPDLMVSDLMSLRNNGNSHSPIDRYFNSGHQGPIHHRQVSRQHSSEFQAQASLQARVLALESQLAAERMRLRARVLEEELHSIEQQKQMLLRQQQQQEARYHVARGYGDISAPPQSSSRLSPAIQQQQQQTTGETSTRYGKVSPQPVEMSNPAPVSSSSGPRGNSGLWSLVSAAILTESVDAKRAASQAHAGGALPLRKRQRLSSSL